MTSLDTRKVRRLGKPRYPTDENRLLQWLGSENLDSFAKCIDESYKMFYKIQILRQIRMKWGYYATTSHPRSVTMIVCSKCADNAPSAIESVHPSSA